MLSKLNLILERKYSIGVIIVVIVGGLTLYNVNQMNVQLNRLNNNIDTVASDATTEYAYNVIKSDLSKYNTESEIMDRFQLWIDQEWSAQLGAVTTLCDNDKTRLDNIVGEDLATTMCRKA